MPAMSGHVVMEIHLAGAMIYALGRSARGRNRAARCLIAARQAARLSHAPVRPVVRMQLTLARIELAVDGLIAVDRLLVLNQALTNVLQDDAGGR